MSSLTYGFVFFSTIATITGMTVAPEPKRPALHAKVIELNAHGKNYLRVLGGPPESVTMKSGLVVLAPNESVGKHTTGSHEELLVVLNGSGEMSFADGSILPVTAEEALYCPPETEHDVKNTGKEMLQYVYVVADAK